jgi:WD40 repeat protein
VSVYYAIKARDRARQADANAARADQKTGEVQAALQRLQRVSYAQNIALARGELEANNVPGALSALGACPAELRHWEWRYLDNLCRGEALRLTSSEPNLFALAYRPDGEVLAAGGGMIGYGPFVGSQELVLWDGRSGKPLKPSRARAPLGAITGVAWSPDGTALALGLWCLDDARDVVMGGETFDESRAGRVEIWNVAKGTLRRSLLGHHSFVNGVAWSADGRMLASAGSDRVVLIRDAATGNLLHRLEGHKGQVMSVAFSPTTDLLASAGQGPLHRGNSRTLADLGEVKLWDVKSGREKFALAGHPQGVLAIAFSPDGTVLASASRDRTVKLWDTRTGELRRTLFGHTDDVQAVAFSSAGSLLATAGADRGVRLWNWAEGKPLTVLRGHTLTIRALAYHPDGRRLASLAYDFRRHAELKTWDTAQAREVAVCQVPGDSANDLELSPDGRRMAANGSRAGEDPAWHVFDITTGKYLYKVPSTGGNPHAVRLSADGTRLITRAGIDRVTVQVLDAARGRLLSSFAVRQYEPKGRVFYFRVDPALTDDGECLAVWKMAENAIVVRKCADGRELRRFAFAPAVDRAALGFSPDGRRLAAVCEHRFPNEKVQWRMVNATVWATDTGQPVLSEAPKDFHVGSLEPRLSPDGAFMAVIGNDRRIRLWNMEQGTSDDLKQDSNNSGLVFSSDGKRLATVETREGRPYVRVWETATRRELFTLKDFVESSPSWDASGQMVFSADGRRLFTNLDGTLKVWDAVGGQLLLTQRPTTGPLRLSRDETRLAAAGLQGATLIWYAPRP